MNGPAKPVLDNAIEPPLRRDAHRCSGNPIAIALIVAGSLLVIALPGCGIAHRPPASPPSLESAYRANRQLDLLRSRRIYAAVAGSKSTPDSQRVTALLWLAHQDLQFYRDYPSALRRLHQADSLGLMRSAVWQWISSVQRRARHYPEARSAARMTQVFADSADIEQPAAALYSYAVFDEAREDLKKGLSPRPELLDTASQDLRALLDREPWQPAASLLLLGISLLHGDGPNALAAWRSYYWLEAADSIPGLLAKPGKELAALLPGWRDRPLSADERERLVLALAQSGFSTYAALLATDPRLSGRDKIQDRASIREIVAFEEFTSAVREQTEAFYRRTAVGGGRNGFLPTILAWFRDRVFRYRLQCAKKCLWRQLSFAGERPPFDDERFAREMEQRFGLGWLAHSSNGYFGVKAGFILRDETRVAAQYSCTVTIRYLLVDRIFCNSYAGWFSNTGGYGGLASKFTIYLFRTDGVKEAIASWDMAVNPKRRSERECYIQQHRAADDSLARENPYAYLPDLRVRLAQSSSRHLLDSLKAQGLREGDLRRAYLSAIYVRDYEAPTYAHEVRHAIDRIYFPGRYHSRERIKDRAMFATEIEYHAKLSEIAFAPAPKLAFGGILSSTTGDNSTHGKANARLMKAVVAWMADNPEQIRGVDINRPLLPQFDLLTDEQVREMFRSLDPLEGRNR